MYICVAHVDARTGIPCTVAPMSHGPAFPAVKGLRVEWANQSQWPTDFPLFYGTCDADADTTIPGVVRALTQAEYDAAWAQEFGPAAVQERIVQQTQQRLDDFARSRGYDSCLSCCTYATSPTPRFAAEGQYCVGARDATWAKLYEMLDEVLAGTRPMPSGYADVEPELPVLAWPNS